MPSALTDSHYSTLLHSTGLVVPASLYANIRFTANLRDSQLERILLYNDRLLHRCVFSPDMVLPYACQLAYDNPFALVSDRFNTKEFVEYPTGAPPNGRFNTIKRSLLGRTSLFIADQDRIGFMNGLVSQTSNADISFNIYTRSILATDGLGVEWTRREVLPKLFRDARGVLTTFVRPGFFQTFEGRTGIFRFFECQFSEHETPDWLLASATRTFLDRGIGYRLRLNDLSRSILSLPRASVDACANGLPRKKHRMAPTAGAIEAAGRDYLDARDRMLLYQRWLADATKTTAQTTASLTNENPRAVPPAAISEVEQDAATGECAAREAREMLTQRYQLAAQPTAAQVDDSLVPPTGSTLLQPTEIPSVVPGVAQDSAGGAAADPGFLRRAGEQ